jgi:hypothetical protein
MDEIWDLWFPNAGATGLSFARCRVGADAAADRVLVHAAPRHLEVVVRDPDGAVVAEGRHLRRDAPGPMSLLIRDGATIRLQDHWPTQDDLGALVLLPGGEAGILTSWWHAPDHTRWRWQLEFSNAAAAPVDPRRDEDHTQRHDNAHPEVPHLRQPARPRPPAFAPGARRAAHAVDDP